jgi:ribosomal protein S18 acetylase RimI-like enzyme
MIEIRRNKEEFSKRLTEVAQVYQAAFAGPPWKEQLPLEEAVKRIEVHAVEEGFDALLAYEPPNKIVGSLWYEDLNVDALEEKKGSDLAKFTSEVQKQGLERVIYTLDTVVDPAYQGRGIASSLKDQYIKEIDTTSPNGAVVLTRHRDDNTGIIRTSEKQGFLRTRIRMPSSQNPKTAHEYWYKVFPPKP